MKCASTSTIIIIMLSFCLAGLSGCMDFSSSHTAPVIDGWRQPVENQTSYTVHAGDSLYTIALGYDLDYREIARLNHLQAPYHLNVGQRLVLVGGANSGSSDRVASRVHAHAQSHSHGQPTFKFSSGAGSGAKSAKSNLNSKSKNNAQGKLASAKTQDRTLGKPVKTQSGRANSASLAAKKSQRSLQNQRKSSQSSARSKHNFVATSHLHWRWPARGKVLRKFSTKSPHNKGIDIAGRLSQAIYAAAPGKVVYSGQGLRGYGSLLIIKHNHGMLSAYAFNRKLLVKEGDWVKAGQKVALMGRDNKRRAVLHFEIRRAGKPINPQRYLPRRRRHAV